MKGFHSDFIELKSAYQLSGEALPSMTSMTRVAIPHNITEQCSKYSDLTLSEIIYKLSRPILI